MTVQKPGKPAPKRTHKSFDRRSALQVSVSAVALGAVTGGANSAPARARSAPNNGVQRVDSGIEPNVQYWKQEDWTAQPERTLIGYCWPWTARPGETVSFKVSTYADAPYQADLVKVRRGNMWPAQEMLRETQVPSSFAGSYQGRNQRSAPGSYVEIPASKKLGEAGSFTVQTYVMPKVILKEGQPYKHYGNVTSRFEGFGLEDIVEDIDEQTLVARWDNAAKKGWSLYLDRLGRTAFKMSDEAGNVQTATLQTPLLTERWYLVSATYDAETNQLWVHSQGVQAPSFNEYAIDLENAQTALPDGFVPVQDGALRFGAVMGRKRGDRRRAGEQCLNGRLDSVRLARGALSKEDIAALAAYELARGLKKSIIGFWDFAPGTGTTKVHDLSKNELHGTAVNAPYRGVVGVRWDGQSEEWNKAPESYGACHFHDDDLADAEWEEDFSFTIPDGFPSGVYAARLRHGPFTEHIPFFVAPPKGQTTAKIAFLVSTTSYAAYSNFDEQIRIVVPVLEQGVDGTPKVVKETLFDPALVGEAIRDSLFIARHRKDVGGGVYRKHTGGDAVWHAANKVPNINVKLSSGYSKLTMDSLLLDWMEAQGIDYDVITDDLLEAEGASVLKPYTAVVSGHHPEYYSGKMLDGVEGYTDSGGRFMYMGGNGFFWSTAAHKELPGLFEVRKIVLQTQTPFWIHQESFNEFDGSHGSLWSFAGRPSASITGLQFDSVTLASRSKPYKRTKASKDPRAAFVFDGIDNELIGDYGLSGAGAAGIEVDKASYAYGTPRHALILASSLDFDRPWGVQGGTNIPRYNLITPSPKAQITFFETPAGGAVFSVGSMAYVGALAHNDYDNDISRLTLNVLQRFADPAPFEMPDL